MLSELDVNHGTQGVCECLSQLPEVFGCLFQHLDECEPHTPVEPAAALQPCPVIFITEVLVVLVMDIK
jgi:hypothetical protein